VIASWDEVPLTMHDHRVRCIVIGGRAAIFHGAARSRSDVGLVYAAGLQAILEERQQFEPGA
jgi:hypothetical protein